MQENEVITLLIDHSINVFILEAMRPNKLASLANRDEKHLFVLCLHTHVHKYT